MKRHVVITGLGVITAIGQDVETFWSNCTAGKTCVERIPEQWFRYGDFNSHIWSPLPRVDYSRYGISRIETKQLDNTTLITLACSFQALDSAGLEYAQVDKKRNTYAIKAVNPERFGVFMGTGIGGVSSFTQSFSHQVLHRTKTSLIQLIKDMGDDPSAKSLEDILPTMISPKRFNPFGVSMAMPNACSGNPAIKFGLYGSNLTYCSACASGTVAIGHGFKAVSSGEVDICLVGGVEYLSDSYGTFFLGFDAVRALAVGNDDPDKANRPFDTDRTGFLFSEGGGAVLVIEDLEHARARGAEIIAEITGYAETCDGYNIMMMEKNGTQITRMITQALADAGITTRDVDYINAHGTGTPLNDETETHIIETLFGREVLINSTKSLLGHTLGASGAIEAVVTALSIKDKTTHICKNLDNPMKELNFVTKACPYPIRNAISQSFGFGGHNAVLVMGECH